MKRLAWAMLPLFLSGCANEEFSDLKEFLASTGQGAKQNLEPLPPVLQVKEFTYDPTNLQDPFRPRNMKPSKGGGGGVQPDLERPKGPLEQDPLDSLRMVGTLYKGGTLYALVRRPDGTLYRVTKGHHIGQNFGAITDINETGIDIKEIIQDGGGDWMESKARMELKE